SLDGFYKPAPELTLSLTEALVVDTNTSLVAREAVATGRDRAWGNTLTPGVAWQIDPLTSLRGNASWTVQRYDADELQDSDVYRAAATFERSLTRRLAGTLGYDAGYFDIQREPTTWTHTPRAGVVFRATETVTLGLSAGPTFELRDGEDSRVTPAVSASYVQRFSFGTVSASYERFVGTAGGVGGTTDNQAFGAQLQVTSLLRGLTLAVAPRYNIEESDDDRVDIRSFTLSLSAAYRLTAWMSAVAAYRFFHQRSDSTALTGLGLPIATDADQNRVWVGLQLGWPVRFD
ncbi:MAG TPA: hypothetical protein VFX28_14955, partial [Methylomirabilota bacterium]|nr:hypothetical protein [Methylomirabilota bacterium]